MIAIFNHLRCIPKTLGFDYRRLYVYLVFSQAFNACFPYAWEKCAELKNHPILPDRSTLPCPRPLTAIPKTRILPGHESNPCQRQVGNNPCRYKKKRQPFTPILLAVEDCGFVTKV